MQTENMQDERKAMIEQKYAQPQEGTLLHAVDNIQIVKNSKLAKVF